MTIAGIGGRARVLIGAGPTSIGRVTVTAGCAAGPGAAGGCAATGAGGGAASGGAARAGDGAGGAAGGGCGRAGAVRAAPGAGGATLPACPSGRAAGGGTFASPARASGAGGAALPSPGDRFIGGPSSALADVVVDDEASASPFAFGKSFEKMLIRRTSRINDSSASGTESGPARVRSRLHCYVTCERLNASPWNGEVTDLP